LIRKLGMTKLLATAIAYDKHHKGLVGETHNPYWDELQRRSVEKSAVRAMLEETPESMRRRDAV